MLKKKEPCASCGVAGGLRCGRCKKVSYCTTKCQRSHWKAHKAACTIVAAAGCLSAAAAAPPPAPGPPPVVEEALRVATRGAAGWASFTIEGQHFLAVANFFTSSPRSRPAMSTDSVIYAADLVDGALRLTEHQRFRTKGAHGAAHVRGNGRDFLVFPNYYGGDVLVVKWVGHPNGLVEESQRLIVDGGGNVVAFEAANTAMLSVAEFNGGRVRIYALTEHDTFLPFQDVDAPGCGATTTVSIDGDLYLVAAAYVTRESGWRPRSKIFRWEESKFVYHSELQTVGAHGVAALSPKVAGTTRHFLFFSNDKDERTTKQKSQLFEWDGNAFVPRQTIDTDGAHAAELFTAADGRHWLAVANLGDRGTNSYRRDSALYAFDPSAAVPLTLAQKLPTQGATDFTAFDLGGRTYLAVSNEQDDRLGGDIDSTIWAFRPFPRPEPACSDFDELL